MLALISRHVKVHTRDRMAFLMSFLSVIILIFVYQIFLGQIQIDAIKTALHSDSIAEDTIQMVNYWLISGLTTITSMTGTLGAFGVMVVDREKKLNEDFMMSPMSPMGIELTYTIFAILFGILLTVFSCIFAIGFFNGFSSLLDFSVIDYVHILGIISFGALLSAGMTLPILIFVHTSSAFTTLNTIIGTFIGFISGVYLSIGSVGKTLQQVMTWFPLTQVNALLKQVLMKDSLTKVFDGADQTVLTHYMENYGLILKNASGDSISNHGMLTYCIGVIVSLFILQFIVKKVKNKSSF